MPTTLIPTPSSLAFSPADLTPVTVDALTGVVTQGFCGGCALAAGNYVVKFALWDGGTRYSNLVEWDFTANGTDWYEIDYTTPTVPPITILGRAWVSFNGGPFQHMIDSSFLAYETGVYLDSTQVYDSVPVPTAVSNLLTSFQTITVSASDASNEAYFASTDQPWLFVTPASGVTPQSETVTFDPSGLGPGIHTGNIILDAGCCNFANSGAIAAASVANGGQGYVAGESFQVQTSALSSCPCAVPTGIIDTVDGLGAVTSFHITYGGDCHLVSPVQDTIATPGDGTFTINITAITPNVGGCESHILVPVTVAIPGPPPPPGHPCIPAGGNGIFISDLELYIGPATALYTNPLLSAALDFVETITEGRHAIVLDFNQGGGLYARDLGTIFSWTVASGTVLYVWQPAVIPMPEGIYGRATDWLDSGGAKFIQGVIIEADSFNAAKTFFLQDSDTLTMHPLNETPATFNQQSVKAFSCVPFVAHSARVISTDGVEWRVWSTNLVFQPWPELCFNWQTEMTSLGMIGWGHVREMNVSYVSTSPVTLVLTFDAWPTITISLPSTGGLQAKTKVTLPANKFKLIGLQTFSTDAAHRVFADDLQLKIKSWGSTEAYQVLRPFGGPSRTGATV